MWVTSCPPSAGVRKRDCRAFRRWGLAGRSGLEGYWQAVLLPGFPMPPGPSSALCHHAFSSVLFISPSNLELTNTLAPLSCFCLKFCHSHEKSSYRSKVLPTPREGAGCCFHLLSFGMFILLWWTDSSSLENNRLNECLRPFHQKHQSHCSLLFV